MAGRKFCTHERGGHALNVITLHSELSLCAESFVLFGTWCVSASIDLRGAITPGRDPTYDGEKGLRDVSQRLGRNVPLCRARSVFHNTSKGGEIFFLS